MRCKPFLTFDEDLKGLVLCLEFKAFGTHSFYRSLQCGLFALRFGGEFDLFHDCDSFPGYVVIIPSLTICEIACLWVARRRCTRVVGQVVFRLQQDAQDRDPVTSSPMRREVCLKMPDATRPTPGIGVGHFT